MCGELLRRSRCRRHARNQLPPRSETRAQQVAGGNAGAETGAAGQVLRQLGLRGLQGFQGLQGLQGAVQAQPARGTFVGGAFGGLLRGAGQGIWEDGGGLGGWGGGLAGARAGNEPPNHDSSSV